VLALEIAAPGHHAQHVAESEQVFRAGATEDRLLSSR
jgi:hypothetical protein